MKRNGGQVDDKVNISLAQHLVEVLIHLRDAVRVSHLLSTVHDGVGNSYRRHELRNLGHSRKEAISGGGNGSSPQYASTEWKVNHVPYPSAFARSGTLAWSTPFIR